MRIAANVALFYAGWFAAAFAAAAGRAELAALACLAVLAVHLALSGLAFARELRLAAICGAVGLLVETSFAATGLTAFPATPGLGANVPPAWIVTLWLAFATLLNVSLEGLKERPVLAAALAAPGGAGSYYGGMKIGALTLAEPLLPTLAVIALAWAIAFPLLLWIARRTR